MSTPRSAVINDMSRVWLMEDGADPATAPEYMGVWKGGALSWGFGDSSAVEIPSDSQLSQFQEVATLAGTEEKPSTTLTARYTHNLSDMLRLVRRRCTHDVQLHIGKCGDLMDFTGGWEKIIALDKFRISNYNTEDLGALSSDERAAVNESIDIQATDLYEIGRLSMAEICSVAVIQEVLAVTFCDSSSCGSCGVTSNGCQKLYALIKAAGGSPGLGAQVVYSDDGGSTCSSTVIDTLAANEDPDDFACMGNYLVVVSEDSGSHHYALKEEILLGTETWAEMTTGYVGGGEPRCIFCLKPGYAWIGGAGGYVYSLDNPANAPVVLDAGSATTQDLNAIHAYDEENIVAVGAANAVVHSTDGSTFAAVTGPVPAVALTAVWMRSATEWFVGTAGGELYYTKDSGVTWALKGFPGSGAGTVRDIVFVTNQVGYLAHDNAIAGVSRILRTIDGGYQWYVIPEGTGSIPANDRINSLAVCGDPNVVIGGGLADNATDGFLVKATG